ncbi:hypothetical protein AAKU55_003176 [Oxalobacteraceae bacterium GrIS 1.11]
MNASTVTKSSPSVVKLRPRKPKAGPTLLSPPAIVLTPEEDLLLQRFRGTQDAEQKRIISTIVKVTADVFSRHTKPALRLVVGGLK